MMVNLNKLAAELHEAAVKKGFWDVEDAENKHVAKMVSEIGEIVQADRAGIMYEIECEGAIPEGIVAELADFVMMTLDLLVQLGADFDAVAEVCTDYNALKTLTEHIETHMLAMALAAKLISFAADADNTMGSDLAYTIHIAAAWAETHGYDLWDIIRVKMEYNRSRPKLHGRAY